MEAGAARPQLQPACAAAHLSPRRLNLDRLASYTYHMLCRGSPVQQYLGLRGKPVRLGTKPALPPHL